MQHVFDNYFTKRWPWSKTNDGRNEWQKELFNFGFQCWLYSNNIVTAIRTSHTLILKKLALSSQGMPILSRKLNKDRYFFLHEISSIKAISRIRAQHWRTINSSNHVILVLVYPGRPRPSCSRTNLY